MIARQLHVPLSQRICYFVSTESNHNDFFSGKIHPLVNDLRIVGEDGLDCQTGAIGTIWVRGQI